MKISLEIDVPEFDWIDTPTLYRTPIGEFNDIQEVKEIGRLIEYLQRLDEIEWIINSNHQHVRHPFCRELIRDRLRFIPENQIYWFGEQLSYFYKTLKREPVSSSKNMNTNIKSFQMARRFNLKHSQ